VFRKLGAFLNVYAPTRTSLFRRDLATHATWDRRNCKKKHESSQVSTLPKAKSKARSKQNKDMHKFSSVNSERGVPLPVLTSGGE
jgi:hypothetical protein